jgi:hypothetical protein
VAAENTVERDKEERELSAKRKKNREVGFLSTFHLIFFTLRAWNPPLFIRDERGTFYL